MIWVAAGALGLSGLVATALTGMLRWQSRAHERERQAWTQERGTLINQICFLSGKVWSLPPENGRVLSPPSDPDADYHFIGDPDQLDDWE